MNCDLVIRGGTVVTTGSSGDCDVGVLEGKVAQMGGSLRGRREIDASGALVLPGGVDMHTHLTLTSPPVSGAPTWIDDFASGSRAAVAGGVTTVGNMTFTWEEQSLFEAIARDLAAAEKDAAVDVVHPVLMSPSAESVAELPALAAAGHTSVKLFMMLPEFESRIDEMVPAIAARRVIDGATMQSKAGYSAYDGWEVLRLAPLHGQPRRRRSRRQRNGRATWSGPMAPPHPPQSDWGDAAPCWA